MRNTIIHPSKLSGTVIAPSSKSAAHRALIAASLANGTSTIHNIGDNDDIVASIKVATALGTTCKRQGNDLVVTGIVDSKKQKSFIDCECNESGSTLRFFTPIAAALGVSANFAGKGRLPQRPMDSMLEILKKNGVTVREPDGYMFSLAGKLEADKFFIEGHVSSQYITGMLFALPLLDKDSELHITTPLESSRYVDMTVEMIKEFGVTVTKTDYGYMIQGGQQYKSRDIIVEGDYSSAAFWFGAGALGLDIKVKGLRADSLQADKDILAVLKEFGASVKIENDTVTVKGGNLKGIRIDASGIPDSVPILAVVASQAEGETVIYNAERLRIKESDRLESTTAGLKILGAEISETDDGLKIIGKSRLNGGKVSGYNDHRIAMAMSIAGLVASNNVEVTGTECVEKSYPDFYKDLESVGGVIDVVTVG